MKTIVAKFGGTSLADAEQFRKIRRIVEEGPERRILVASAPGKRFPEDTKVTDLLLDCWEKAYAGQPFEAVLQEIRGRFQEILKGLGMDFPLDEEIETLREHLNDHPEKDYMASRGEYLNSRILAEFLGYTFVDPAWCVCFTESGELDQTMTRRAMGAALRPLKKAVIAGFYGADSDGIIHTSSCSLGAETKPLGEFYTEQEAAENLYISPDRTVDASKGYLPDTTWYFKDQFHDATAYNDTALEIAKRVLSDDSFKDIYSDASLPQFGVVSDNRK